MTNRPNYPAVLRILDRTIEEAKAEYLIACRVLAGEVKRTNHPDYHGCGMGHGNMLLAWMRDKARHAARIRALHSLHADILSAHDREAARDTIPATAFAAAEADPRIVYLLVYVAGARVAWRREDGAPGIAFRRGTTRPSFRRGDVYWVARSRDGKLIDSGADLPPPSAEASLERMIARRCAV